MENWGKKRRETRWSDEETQKVEDSIDVSYKSLDLVSDPSTYVAGYYIVL
jgi:hypothetical protein